MKRKIFSCIAASVLFCATISAQVFIIERGANSLPYTNIKSAIDALQDNDLLYLPPGEHSLSGYTWEGYDGTQNHAGAVCVNKKVSIYGGGCSNGANSTVLKNGTFIIGENAAGSLITGVRFDAALILDNVSDCIVSRCLTNYLYLYGDGGNNVITESEFRTSVNSSSSPYANKGGNGVSCIFSKCIFDDANTLRVSTVYNCIFKYSGYFYTCTLNNNIFIISTTVTNAQTTLSGTQNTFAKNLWVGGTPSVRAEDNNSLNNEITKEPYDNVFVDAGAGDYHLQDACNGKNAGTDGKDVGIYGTSVPFKENRLPSIPNFSLKSISPETDATGKLPVNIVVEAQER
jgi:hypothetical protein